MRSIQCAAHPQVDRWRAAHAGRVCVAASGTAAAGAAARQAGRPRIGRKQDAASLLTTWLCGVHSGNDRRIREKWSKWTTEKKQRQRQGKAAAAQPKAAAAAGAHSGEPAAAQHRPAMQLSAEHSCVPVESVSSLVNAALPLLLACRFLPFSRSRARTGLTPWTVSETFHGGNIDQMQWRIIARMSTNISKPCYQSACVFDAARPMVHLRKNMANFSRMHQGQDVASHGDEGMLRCASWDTSRSLELVH
jgi:hypothetical protein